MHKIQATSTTCNRSTGRRHRRLPLAVHWLRARFNLADPTAIVIAELAGFVDGGDR